LRKKRDKSFRRVLEVIRGPKRFKTDGVAFHSFAAVSPRIFFKEYFKEAWLTHRLAGRKEENTRSSGSLVWNTKILVKTIQWYGYK